MPSGEPASVRTFGALSEQALRFPSERAFASASGAEPELAFVPGSAQFFEPASEQVSDPALERDAEQVFAQDSGQAFEPAFEPDFYLYLRESSLVRFRH